MMSSLYLMLSIICYTAYSQPTANQCESSVEFYSRQDWNATTATDVKPLDTPVPYVVIHHTYIPAACTSHEECVKSMKSMQTYHKSLGWGDIGYNFCLGNKGDVYEGRGWETKGIHAGPANGVSVGICLIGDWRVLTPPDEMIEATQNLIDIGVAKGFIQTDYKVVGHKQVMATECPGTALFDVISKWDHFSNKFT